MPRRWLKHPFSKPSPTKSTSSTPTLPAMSTKVDPAGLRALVKLIDQSVETVIAEYAKKGATVPTLDVLTPGPFDEPVNCTAALEEALHTLEGACGQLTVTCASPGHTVVNKALALYEPASFNLVLTVKVADHLGEDAQGIHIADLAKKTGVDEGKLGRIMRYLATSHVFKEVKQNVFANNRMSAKMRSSDPTSSLLGHITDDSLAAAGKFGETISDPQSTFELSPDHAPFRRAFGKSVFEHHATPEGKLRGERFNRAMLGWGQISGASELLSKVYPWASQPAGTAICDVGGGNGYVLIGLLKDHSHLRGTVSDLAGPIGDAKKLWKTEYPEAIESQRIDFQLLDFFKDSPVKGHSFYYMRHVLHSFNDPDCVKILKSTRAVMSPSSKLLIQEFALPYLVRMDSGSVSKQAPEPLLPNYGIGRLIPYTADLHMLNNANAKERTLAEFENLASQVDLKVANVYDCGEMSLLELIPV